MLIKALVWWLAFIATSILLTSGFAFSVLLLAHDRWLFEEIFAYWAFASSGISVPAFLILVFYVLLANQRDAKSRVFRRMALALLGVFPSLLVGYLMKSAGHPIEGITTEIVVGCSATLICFSISAVLPVNALSILRSVASTPLPTQERRTLVNVLTGIAAVYAILLLTTSVIGRPTIRATVVANAIEKYEIDDRHGRYVTHHLLGFDESLSGPMYIAVSKGFTNLPFVITVDLTLFQCTSSGGIRHVSLWLFGIKWTLPSRWGYVADMSPPDGCAV